MRTTKGFTLTELLIVIGIILVLSGTIYALLAPARVKAKETSCMSNLKQLYLAVSLYGQDNSDAHEFEELDGHVSLPRDYKPVLISYGAVEGNFFCPELPVTPKASNLYSSYMFMNNEVERPSTPMDNGGVIPAKLQAIRDIRKRATGKMPLIVCSVHDEFRFQKVDPPGTKEPYLIYITTMGSAHSERVKFLDSRPIGIQLALRR